MHPLPIPYYHVTKGLCTADPSNRTSRPTIKKKKNTRYAKRQKTQLEGSKQASGPDSDTTGILD